MDCISWTRSFGLLELQSGHLAQVLDHQARDTAGSALIPVPTAVPPMFSSRSQSAACSSFTRCRATVCP